MACVTSALEATFLSPLVKIAYTKIEEAVFLFEVKCTFPLVFARGIISHQVPARVVFV